MKEDIHIQVTSKVFSKNCFITNVVQGIVVIEQHIAIFVFLYYLSFYNFEEELKKYCIYLDTSIRDSKLIGPLLRKWTNDTNMKFIQEEI